MAASYVAVKTARSLPRLPLEGSLDLTYRCNNACLHCWLWLPPCAPEQNRELTFDEIRRIAGEARALGTRAWHLSGGEPMLRADFPDIFDCLTRQAVTYSLNTNGTLITPDVARLLTRKGRKLVALYGATAETYDRVTRHHGGFEAMLRGVRYLQEAGAGFTVQLVPMRANWHEWQAMQAFAETLSPHQRLGAAWLYLSARGGPARNAEIDRQRLHPRDAVALDPPDTSREEPAVPAGAPTPGDDRLFAACIPARREFHIDPYGWMSFCAFLQDPALRYDLRRGTLRDGWEVFIPALADQVRGGDEYAAHCGACDLRAGCRWCPAYGYLEHGRYSAPVEYLCAMARAARHCVDKPAACQCVAAA